MQHRYPPQQQTQQHHPYSSISPANTTISPSSLHAAIPPAPYYNTDNGDNDYSSSPSQTFPMQVSVEIPARGQPKSLEHLVRHLLTPQMLETSPGSTATTLIETLNRPGQGETTPTLRKEILNRMRDHASQEFYKVWAKSTVGMDILKGWLKSAATKPEWEETLMPLLHVCHLQVVWICI